MANAKFDLLLEEIRALHASKNHDYATAEDHLANVRRCQALGVDPLLGVLVRLTDKQSRIEQLVRGKTPKHESLRDTLIDQAVYSLIGVLLLDEKNES